MGDGLSAGLFDVYFVFKLHELPIILPDNQTIQPSNNLNKLQLGNKARCFSFAAQLKSSPVVSTGLQWRELKGGL